MKGKDWTALRKVAGTMFNNFPILQSSDNESFWQTS